MVGSMNVLWIGKTDLEREHDRSHPTIRSQILSVCTAQNDGSGRGSDGWASVPERASQNVKRAAFGRVANVPVWGMVISADAVRERPLIPGTAPRSQRCETCSAMTAASHPAGEAATTPYLGHGFALTPVGMRWRPHEPTRRLAPTGALENDPEASMGLRRRDRWPSP